MTQIILPKDFLTIAELITKWNLTIHDLEYAAESGKLKVFVRPIAIEAALVPLLSFSPHALDILKDCAVSPVDIYLAFCARDSEFTTIHLQEYALAIKFNDLIVLKSDCEEFERAHIANDFQLFTDDFREFRIHGELFRLGFKQAKIAKHLHAAAFTGNPWVHGKELMKIAQAEGYKIQNLFSSQKNWHKAIESNGRGYYRFNLPL